MSVWEGDGRCCNVFRLGGGLNIILKKWVGKYLPTMYIQVKVFLGNRGECSDSVLPRVNEGAASRGWK